MFLKIILLLALGIGSLTAADFTVTVTVSDAMASEILATVTAWRAKQLDENGDPKYATNGDLGKAILYQALRRILREQCGSDPNSCPASIKAFLDAKVSAEASLQAEIDAAVTP